MSYTGLQPITQSLVTSQQFFSGDGTTLQFNLQQSVGKATDVSVLVGSVPQIPTVNYAASGTSLVFTSAPTAGTNNISVTFLAGALNTVNLTANVFPLGTNVSPSISGIGAATTGIYWPSTATLAVTAQGNIAVTFSSVPTATSTTTGAVRVNGGLGTTGAHYVGGTIFATSGTNSTNQTTGALVVTVGIGATGSMYLGGSMTISGGLTVAGSFNTTATNSLVVNDPFLFLANTNVGNAVDIGVVGTYNDGVTQRYEGIYRAASDGRFRLFTNLSVAPTTLVSSTDPSFVLADLWLGNANVSARTAATSSTTGALVVPFGGIGVGGAIAVNSQNNGIAIYNSGTSGVGNIGTSGGSFNTVFALATSAQYSDLAENYLADAEYAPGTVLDFGGEQEVTQSTKDLSTRIAGVVSTQPSYLMNSGLTAGQGQYVATVAFQGRVPCKVQGIVNKGDMMVSAGNGYARAEANPIVGSVIGKALENHNDVEGVIEVVVGRD